jgi:hypothetical protein
MKKSSVPVKFISTVPGLSGIKDLNPRPSKEFIPTWWKEMPKGALREGSKYSPDYKTIKMCPALPDTFSQGYVVPMWADSIIKYSKESDTWEWSMSNTKDFAWDTHPPQQLLNHVSKGVSFRGAEASFVFKAVCPWRLITPPGYSVLQLPMFYHFEKEFSVMPGVIHTDVHHEINQQVLYHGNGDEVFIPRGTPIAQYIPFKRLDTELLVTDMTVEDTKEFLSQDLNIRSEFFGNYLRRKRQSK